MNVTRTDRELGTYPQGMQFRRNTLLEYGDVRIVVSTIGRFVAPDEMAGILKDKHIILGPDRYYETLAWHAKKYDYGWDSNIGRGQLRFAGPWAIPHVDETSDADANQMHEMAVEEITARLEEGDRFGEPPAAS
jgi:hypothetical protein